MKLKKIMLGKLTLAVALGIVAISADNVTANGILHRVTAGGPDVCEALGLAPGCDANFSLVAIQFYDMSITGQFEDRLSGLNGFHGTVDCLFVLGNQAWVGGVITSEFGRGDDFLVTVVDNGTSKNDPPDEISFTVTGDDIGFTCETAVGLFRRAGFIFEVPQGQVKVK